jgi:hypothetical protein
VVEMARVVEAKVVVEMARVEGVRAALQVVVVGGVPWVVAQEVKKVARIQLP